MTTFNKSVQFTSQKHVAEQVMVIPDVSETLQSS